MSKRKSNTSKKRKSRKSNKVEYVADYMRYDSPLNERQEKYCRCLYKVAQQQSSDCLRKQKWGRSDSGGKQCYNPYAICTKSTKRKGYIPCFPFYDLDKMPDKTLKSLMQLKNKKSIDDLYKSAEEARKDRRTTIKRRRKKSPVIKRKSTKRKSTRSTRRKSKRSTRRSTRRSTKRKSKRRKSKQRGGSPKSDPKPPKPVDKKLYAKAKSTVKKRFKGRWSAYASGQLVAEYKRLFAKKYGKSKSPYKGKKSSGKLKRWYDEDWRNVCKKTKSGKYAKCGRKKSSMKAKDYPYCRPMKRVTSGTPKTIGEMSKEELRNMCKKKKSSMRKSRGKQTNVQRNKTKSRRKRSSQSGGSKRTNKISKRSKRSKKQIIHLRKSNKSGKKWMITLDDGHGKTVHFGAAGMSDYTKHKDPDRKQRYIIRHGGNDSGTKSKRENWAKSGLGTAGFWSRWLLWEEPSLEKSVRAIERKFGVKIVRK